MDKKYYLAIDIGASSGRHIVGREEDGKLLTDEVYRFSNGAKESGGRLVWDMASLSDSVIKGIKCAFEKYPQITSLAIDTWGCDYVLMNGEKAIAPCICYRDGRTADIIDEVHGKMPFASLYGRTGIQFQPFNTIYQLYEDKKRGRLDDAEDFLMVPEYLTYVLTGRKVHEYTNATTTGLVNAGSGEYDKDIISSLGLPKRLFKALSRAGTHVGRLTERVKVEVGGDCDVVLCATHDTASAVEGIAMPEGEAYISSGTWSLLGIKSPRAHTDERSRAGNWSNEGGVGYIRYQKNIMGMWVVNRLRSELCPDAPFDEIADLARKSRYDSIADINGRQFLSPERMTEAFDVSVPTPPKSTGDYFRCAFLSLAESYKSASAELEANTGIHFNSIYIVGGGAKNKYLNELTQQATGKRVVALPIEATALGNLKIQIERGKA